MAAPQNEHGEVLLIPKTFPTTAHVESIVEKYKKIRLHGLKADPQSFSSTYEEEAQFSYETWVSRILNPLGKTFVSLIEADSQQENDSPNTDLTNAGNEHAALSRLLNDEWVGIVTLLGHVLFPSELDGEKPGMKPWDVYISHGKYSIPLTVPKPDDLKGAHVVYLIVGMYVVPHARRKGHARRLVKATVKAVHDEAIALGASKASITVQVEPNISGARRLYESAGFEVWDEAVEIANRQGDISLTVCLVQEVDLRDFN